MKLLVFAHVPPPHHGQSQMVKYMVDGFRANPALGIEVLHVDARLSSDLRDVGSARGGKLLQLFRYIRQARRLAARHQCTTLFHVPSPPKRTPLYRDWITLRLLRPRLPRVIYHWHASGLGSWIQSDARPWERALTLRWMARVDLSIVLSQFNRSDGEVFQSRRTAVVPNGIVDPCPDYDTTLAGERAARVARKLAAGEPIDVLFLALCSRDKGVFDALEAVRLANDAAARRGQRSRFRLTVAGAFPDAADEREFHERIRAPEWNGLVETAGFLGPDAKQVRFRTSDLFLFPTYYANEGQPLNVVEAMAYGLRPVTTLWRGIPDLLPAGYPGLVETRRPDLAAEAMVRVLADVDADALRRRFLESFTIDRHLALLARTIHESLGGDGSGTPPKDSLDL